MVFLPASVAETGMSKRALSCVLCGQIGARQLRLLHASRPRAAVSATLIGASALTCQPAFAVMVRLAVAVAPTATFGSVFLIS